MASLIGNIDDDLDNNSTNSNNDNTEQMLYQQMLEKDNDMVKLIPIDDTNEFILLDRSEAIEQIGSDVTIVKSLFEDLRNLVYAQQEPINEIEININSAKEYVKTGEKDLIKAEEYQKSYYSTWSVLSVIAGGATVLLISLINK